MIGPYEFPYRNSYGPMVLKVLWKLPSWPVLVHRVLFSALFSGSEEIPQNSHQYFLQYFPPKNFRKKKDKLLQERRENSFVNDWSIWISPEIRMDQWSWKFFESCRLDRYWSIECSSLHSGLSGSGPIPTIWFTLKTLSTLINEWGFHPRYSVLLFLGVFVSLVFFFPGIFLVFLSVLCLFYGVFEGSHSEKNPGCSEIFLGVFEKTKEKKERVILGPSRRANTKQSQVISEEKALLTN